MSAKTETAIWLALKGRINTLSGSYTKAWPGEMFTVPYSGNTLQPYLRIGRVIAAPVRMLIAGGKRHERTGSLMITLVSPLGRDISVYDQAAATVAEHFIDGTSMRYGGVCVTVTAYPYVMEGYEQNGYWETNIRIPWRCFA